MCMKVKKMFKVIFVSFSMALIMLAFTPELGAEAATKSIETRYINGDGVRLRKEGWAGGTILELMYDGEQINYYPDIYGTDTEYNYMQRLKTETYGYVDHHYTRFYK